MRNAILDPADAAATETLPVALVREDNWPAFRETLDPAARTWLESQSFKGQNERVVPIPADDGTIARLVLGLGDGSKPFAAAKLVDAGPAGATLRVEAVPQGCPAELLALGFAFGSYRFATYKKPGEKRTRLVAPDGTSPAALYTLVDGVQLTRDLINTPTEDMGPDGLEAAARELAGRHGAPIAVLRGDRLRDSNFPLIHAVGRASTRAPRLIDFTWGEADAPKLTLVGKGVCFDTGGLDIKPASGMRLMKKDMGGAANTLGLASMIMAAGLPVRLRVLIPAVENSIAGNAFRPGDIFRSRKGLTVEIGNTDAEGRLILADALALAAEEEPVLLADFATLTGAARVALGPDVPALFINDDTLASELHAAADTVQDPLWRLPLWPGYDRLLDSKVADLNNVSDGPFGGAITAALFLQRFVDGAGSWFHIDMNAWNNSASAGRPVGGEAMTIRAAFDVIRTRFG